MKKHTKLFLSAFAFGAMVGVIGGVQYVFTNTAEAPTLPPVEIKIEVPAKPIVKKAKWVDPVTEKERVEIADKIATAFSAYEDHVAETMVAIAISESGLNKNATGYNCYYKVTTKELGTWDKISGQYLDLADVSKARQVGYRSTTCRAGHAKFAWSTDGGIFQINSPKPEDYDVDRNIARAVHKYETEGLGAWTVYKTGAYKKHLPRARDLLL